MNRIVASVEVGGVAAAALKAHFGFQWVEAEREGGWMLTEPAAPITRRVIGLAQNVPLAALKAFHGFEWRQSEWDAGWWILVEKGTGPLAYEWTPRVANARTEPDVPWAPGAWATERDAPDKAQVTADMGLAKLIRDARDAFQGAVDQAVTAGLTVECWGMGDGAYDSGSGSLDIGVSVSRRF